jgi:all-beta uncharacterized protein
MRTLARSPRIAVRSACAVVVALIAASGHRTRADLRTPSTIPGPQPIGRSFNIATTGRGEIAGKNAIAFDGTNFLVAWLNSAAPAGVFAARVTPNGSVLDAEGFRISSDTADQLAGPPSVAFDGQQFMVVWVADRCSCSYGQLYGARITTGGAVLDPEGTAITSADSSTAAKIRMATIAFDGANYLVAYRSTQDVIRVLRVTPAGASLDGGDGIALGHGYYPYVVFGAGTYLVTWHDGVGYCHCWIMGALVAADGTAGEAFQIAPEGAGKDNTSAAFDGANFFVAWHDYTGVGAHDINIPTGGIAGGARVSPAGEVLDDPPVKIGDGVHSQNSPRVVFDGANYFVVWTNPMGGYKFRLADVDGARVSPAGSLLDARAIPISAAVSHQFAPVLAFGGGVFLVVWNELGNLRCGAENACITAQLISPSSDSTDAPTTVTPVDGGWTVERTGSDALYAIAGWAPDDVYAVGESGAVTHRDGAGWANQPFLRNRMFGAWATGPADFWTSGWCGETFFHDAGGWQDSNCKRFGITSSIWAANRSFFVGVGTEHLMVQYEGSESTCPPKNGVTCIGINPNVDDGPAWQKISISVTGVDFYGVWGSSATNVYAVGEFGTVVHWDGAVWSPVDGIPTLHTLNAIWGASATDVFVVGDSGRILHYDGTSWTVQPTPTAQHLTAVWGANGTDVFAVGVNGTILHYDGIVWTPQDSGTTTALFGAWGAGGRVYAVGDLGTILSAPTSTCAMLADRDFTVGAAGGSKNIGVTADPACAWSAASDAGWLSITSGASGTGNGTVTMSASPNGGGARTGTLTVGGQLVNVMQISTAFTDDPLLAGSTPIRAAHVLELRSRIDVIRSAHGLVAYTWSDPFLTAGRVIRARNIVDLRDALSEAYAAAALPPPSFAEPIANGVYVKASHLTELRNAVLAIE